jgi:hypothetical protein
MRMRVATLELVLLAPVLAIGFFFPAIPLLLEFGSAAALGRHQLVTTHRVQLLHTMSHKIRRVYDDDESTYFLHTKIVSG